MQPWSDLRTAVEQALPALRAMDEAATSVPPAPGKWCAREVIGHLVDSATNNHGRLVRAQLQDSMRSEGYEQDGWVRVQRYRDRSWPELVELWYRLNLHLADVMEAAPMEELTRARRDHNLAQRAFRSAPANEPATLGWFMEDYVEHLKHHLRQVLG